MLTESRKEQYVGTGAACNNNKYTYWQTCNKVCSFSFTPSTATIAIVLNYFEIDEYFHWVMYIYPQNLKCVPLELHLGMLSLLSRVLVDNNNYNS